jgi:hypothetical protein
MLWSRPEQAASTPRGHAFDLKAYILRSRTYNCFFYPKFVLGPSLKFRFVDIAINYIVASLY